MNLSTIRLLALAALLGAALAAAWPGRGAAAADPVIYVVPGGSGALTGADWANAMDLQPALQAASAGTQVWVKRGTYTPTSGGDRAISFVIKPDVRVYGGFAGVETASSQRFLPANPTILSGDLLGNDSGFAAVNSPSRAENSYHVVRADAAPSGALGAVLDGMIIVGGNANSQFPPSNSGGGLLCASSCALTVAHSQFLGNSALFGGAVLQVSGFLALVHAVVSGNSASASGGGIESDGGNLYLFHSSIAGNAVPAGSVSAIASLGGLNMSNTVVWANSGTALYANANMALIEYSVLQEPFAGAGNIVANPLFIDPDGADNLAGTLDDNLRLQNTSPARNAGSNALIHADIVDIDGDGNTLEPVPVDLDYQPRVADGTVDIGAYEVAGSVQPTATATATSTSTATATATSTSTATATATSTSTATATATSTSTATATSSSTPTSTSTATATSTIAPTSSTAIPTQTSTAMPTSTSTIAPPSTAMPTSTSTIAPTATTVIQPPERLYLPLITR